MRRLGGFVLLCLIFDSAAGAEAATISAATCQASDVQAALNQAGAGDTVSVPSGTCAWTTPVIWTATRDVSMVGAGDLTTMGGGNRTVIVDDIASNRGLLEIDTAASGTFRLAGITFRGGRSGGYVKDGGLVRISGTSRQVRVDHISFNMRSYEPDNSQNTALRFYGWIYGVVDHSVWDLNGIGHALKVEHATYGGHTNGDGAWAAATDFGGGAFIFAEDNVFNGNATNATINDCNAGGRWVMRYNTSNGAQLQTHPTGGAGRGRGCRASEVYGNTFTRATPTPSTPPFNVFFLSSGTSFIWGNTVDASYKNFVTIHSMRRDNNTYWEAPTPEGWGYCGRTFTGTGSSWDGNDDPASGYPCLDQPGRGEGDLLAGDFPNLKNVSKGCTASASCWPGQKLEPIREWLNTFTPAPGWGGAPWAVYHPEVIAENRDYYLGTAAFTGASGIGSGPRSSRPAACTPGVAYWSTDAGGNWNTVNQTSQDGALDVCVATNEWSSGAYTPHQYPHPLVVGGPTTAPAGPAAPRNVRILPPNEFD
jgi:hypothetical protein